MLVRAVLVITLATIAMVVAARAWRREGRGDLPATVHELAAGGTGHGVSVVIAAVASVVLLLLAWTTARPSRPRDAHAVAVHERRDDRR